MSFATVRRSRMNSRISARRDSSSGARRMLLTGNPKLPEISASLGADAYVEKPFELTELLRTVEQQLDAIANRR
jgi:CheY-like chemotaxis protein